MIEIESLSKSYSQSRLVAPALSDFSLAVEKGQAVALLGRNGAGKSTVIGILATLIRADSGRVSVGGFDLATHHQQVRERIGVVQQDVGLYRGGRVRQLLTLHARLFGLSRIGARRRADELIELARLGDVTGRKVRQLSGGMKRRLDISLSLVHEPPVLLLDEATSSLDPASRKDLWGEFGRLRDTGTCILFASQDIEETEHLADWVGVLTDGTLQDVLSPSGVRALWDTDHGDFAR
jgi:ABC-2 type transport system ATP-binding protein